MNGSDIKFWDDSYVPSWIEDVLSNAIAHRRG